MTDELTIENLEAAVKKMQAEGQERVLSSGTLCLVVKPFEDYSAGEMAAFALHLIKELEDDN